MKSFIKRFPPTTPPEEIRREAILQRRAAAIGISPRVIRCTQKTIVMENVGEMPIADKYGDNIENIPEWIKTRIVEILCSLYTDLKIEYIDVTPYNFIEKDDVVWIIDFGHAYAGTDDEIDPYLNEILQTRKLSKWNPTFL